MSPCQLVAVITLVAAGFFFLGRLYELRNRMIHWHEGFQKAKRIYQIEKLDRGSTDMENPS